MDFELTTTGRLYRKSQTIFQQTLPFKEISIFIIGRPGRHVSWFMEFNTTFNNISDISWRSVLKVEETGVLGENHRLATSRWQTWSDNDVSSTHRLSGIWIVELTTLVIIGTDCTGSCKSNYHTITATTAPRRHVEVLIVVQMQFKLD